MTRLTIALIGTGSMGSAVGRMLAASGARVLTTLEGRSAASVARAREARMEDASLADIAASDFLLSIVPPAVAVDTAERLAPALTQAARKAVYIDCNAVSPHTVAKIAETVDATGAAFVDGGIIGAPSSPKFYVSDRMRRAHARSPTRVSRSPYSMDRWARHRRSRCRMRASRKG